jgi:hypothetical protein
MERQLLAAVRDIHAQLEGAAERYARALRGGIIRGLGQGILLCEDDGVVDDGEEGNDD